MKTKSVLVAVSLVTTGLSVSPSAAEIETVTVTAQKTTQDIQDVPMSITAFSADDAASRQLRSVEDLAAQVPGLEMGELGGTANVTMRGVGLSTLSGGGENSVAINLDGVYLSRPPAAVMIQSDVARIEVLEGPQTTLYGKNAIGGVINYYTPAPTDQFTANLRAGYGDYQSYELAGDVSGSISDHVRGRLFATADGHQGYILNTFNGQRVNGLDGLGVNGAVDIDLGSNAELQLRAHVRNEEFSGPVYGPYKLAADDIIFGVPASLLNNLDPNKIAASLPYHSNRQLAGGSATATFHFTNMDLVSITGYNHFTIHVRADGLSVFVFPVSTDRPEVYDTYSQEIDLKSSGAGAVWIVGVYGQYEMKNVAAVTIVPPLALTIDGKGKGHSLDLAAFADVTYPVTDHTRIYGGGRIMSENQTFGLTYSVNGFSLCSINSPTSTSTTGWSGRLGAQQDVWTGAMFYVQGARGYKSGGFEDFTCNAGYKPETLNSYEAGLKTAWYDNRLIANFSVFHYDYFNLQVEEDNLSGLNFVNAPRAQVDGGEINLVAEPIDNLQLNFGLSLLDARFTKFTASNTDLIANGFETLGESLAGNPLNRSPDYVTDIGAQYTFTWEGFGRLTFRGEAKFSAKYALTEANIRETTNPAYTLANFYIDYADPSDKYVIRAFIKNATNVHLLGGALDAFGSGLLASYGPPRTVGVELNAAL